MNVRNTMITAVITAGLVSGSAQADDINTVIDASARAGKYTSSYEAPKTNIQSNLGVLGYDKVKTNGVVVSPKTNIQSNLEASRNS